MIVATILMIAVISITKGQIEQKINPENLPDILKNFKQRIISDIEQVSHKIRLVHCEVESNRFVNKFYNKFHSSPAHYDIPIMVVLATYGDTRFGNAMGGFLTSCACGEISGAHIVIVKTHASKFLTYIPDIIINSKPATNYESAVANFLQSCNATESQFPWDSISWNYKFPQISHLVRSMRSIIVPVMNKMYNHVGLTLPKDSRILVPRDSELSNINKFTHNIEYYDQPEFEGMHFSPLPTTLLPPRQLRANFLRNVEPFHDNPELASILPNSSLAIPKLPLYPDVTIHYRCGDNLFLCAMGLNPYWLVIKNIPANAKYIYIVTESNQLGHWCHEILQALRNDIQSKFPKSYVIIRSGGQHDYMFVLLSMFTHSGVFIASPSTLSFFAALSNVKGKVFLPRKTFYGNNFNCCKNLYTMSHTPICIWQNNISGELTPKEKITSTQMIETLRNETYINFYPYATHYENVTWKENP